MDIMACCCIINMLYNRPNAAKVVDPCFDFWLLNDFEVGIKNVLLTDWRILKYYFCRCEVRPVQPKTSELVELSQNLKKKLFFVHKFVPKLVILEIQRNRKMVSQRFHIFQTISYFSHFGRRRNFKKFIFFAKFRINLTYEKNQKELFLCLGSDKQSRTNLIKLYFYCYI